MKSTFYTLLLILISLAIHAQDVRSSVSGFSAELDLSYGEWHTSSFFLGNLAELEPIGGGIHFKLGYGFRERFEVFAAYTTMNYNISDEWDRFLNNNIKLGGRVHFGATLKRFRPYIEVAVSNNKFLMDPIYIGNTDGPYELDLSGIGIAPGAGINYFITPNLAAHLNLAFAFGNFSSAEISGVQNEFDENLDYTFFNFSLGMSYFLQ